MKLYNILIKLIYWLLLSNGTQTDQTNKYTDNGPPNKKFRIFTAESGQGDSSTVSDILNPVFASKCFFDPGCVAYLGDPESSYQSANFKTIRDLDTGIVHRVPTDSTTLNIETNKRFESNTGESQADDEPSCITEAETSNATTPCGVCLDQTLPSQKTGPDEGSQDSVSTEKRSEDLPDPFSLGIYIRGKATETFYMFAEPVLGFENPILLTNKTCNHFFPKGSIQSFLQREHIQTYYYLVFLRFKNIGGSFNIKGCFRTNVLFQECKEMFPSKLENFQQSEFGNEIIIAAPFQVLVLKLRINKNLDLAFLDSFDFLFSLVFDKYNNEGIIDSESAWKEYKRSIGFKEPSEVVKLFSVNEIRYSGILSKKLESIDEKKKKRKLNAQFMTLAAEEGAVKSNVCSVTIKGVNVKFLHIPIFKCKKRNPYARLTNKHMEIELYFEDERNNEIQIVHHSVRS